jgi:hypothetical protein
MTSKKSTAKRGGKGTAAPDKEKKRRTVKDRARAIVADMKGYDADTRNAIKNSLDGDGSDLAELVRRAEAGEIIWDVSKPNGDGELPDTAALDYARKAYDAALAHYYTNQHDPFALSRLAVVYEEQQLGDVHIVVTLPGYLRDRAVTDEEAIYASMTQRLEERRRAAQQGSWEEAGKRAVSESNTHH